MSDEYKPTDPGFVYRATEVTVRGSNNTPIDTSNGLTINNCAIDKAILDQLRSRGVTKLVIEI